MRADVPPRDLMKLKPASAPPDAPMPLGLTLLVAFIAMVEIVLTLSDYGYLGTPLLRAQLYETGAFWTGLLHGARPIFQAQPVTMFVSHSLLHGGMLHMVMNMAILLALGRFTADRYGGGVVLPTFLICAVAGGAVFGLLSRGAYPMVGASGAVFGFLGIWTAWDWCRHRAAGVSTRPVWQRIAVLAGLNVLLYYGLGGLLAWEAHLGGFLAGLAIGFLLESRQAANLRDARAELRRRRREGTGEAD